MLYWLAIWRKEKNTSSTNFIYSWLRERGRDRASLILDWFCWFIIYAFSITGITHSSHSTGETWMIWSTNLRSWKKKTIWTFQLQTMAYNCTNARVFSNRFIDVLKSEIIYLRFGSIFVVEPDNYTVHGYVMDNTPLNFFYINCCYLDSSSLNHWILIASFAVDTQFHDEDTKTQRKTIKNNATFRIATIIFLQPLQSQFTTILAADIWKFSASLFLHNRNKNNARHTHIGIEKEKNEIQLRIPKKKTNLFGIFSL